MTPLLSEGLNLALYGMGTVFVFLTMLVFATMLMSWLVTKTSSAEVSAETIEPKKLAAITAAVHQHHNRNKAQS